MFGAAEQALLFGGVCAVNRDQRVTVANEAQAAEAPDALCLAFEFARGSLSILVKHKQAVIQGNRVKEYVTNR